jgi:hypothetical protein
VSSEPLARQSVSATVADFLAAFAIFASLIGIAWHPLRLIPMSLLLALVAAGMRGRADGVPRAAIAITTVSFFLGMTVAVATQNPLW